MRPAAVNALTQLLASDDKKLRDALLEVSDDILGLLGLSNAAGPAFRFAMRTALLLGRALSTMRNQGLSWYQAALDSPNVYDGLLDLKMWRNSDDQRERDKADRILWQAFLADLEAAFAGAFRRVRTGNCIALVDVTDDSHEVLLRVALTSLALAKQANRISARDDPLVVIVTTRRRQNSLNCAAIATVDAADYEQWRQDRNDDWGSWIYVLEMGDIDSDEVDNLVPVGDRFRGPTARALAQRLAHPNWSAYQPNWSDYRLVPGSIGPRRLTHAHPLGYELLVDISAGLATHEWEQILSVTIGADHEPAYVWLLDRLLPHRDAELRNDLVTFSASIDLRSDYREAIGSLAPLDRIEEFCSNDSDMWLSDINGQPRFHPLLRRLLLHELSERSVQHPLNWQLVHSEYFQYFGRSRQKPEEMYHRLSAGDLDSVVTYLFAQLSELDSTKWLDLFSFVTSSPCTRLSVAARNRTPGQERAAHSSDERARQLVRRLTSLVWVSNDPLGDPRLTLDTEIAGDLEMLAGLVDNLELQKAIRDLAAMYRSRRENYIERPHFLA